jgi:hypothetical protein
MRPVYCEGSLGSLRGNKCILDARKDAWNSLAKADVAIVIREGYDHIRQTIRRELSV